MSLKSRKYDIDPSIFRSINRPQAKVYEKRPVPVKALPQNFAKSPKMETVNKDVSKTSGFRDLSAPSTQEVTASCCSDANGIQFTSVAWLIIIPIIILVLLIFLRPTFALEEQNGTTQFNYGALLLWTVLISIFLYIVIYGFNRCCE
jgi:hypothetical protein